MLKRSRTVKFLHAGIDKLLAQHIAHLFIRDPISVFKERLNLDDENDSDHFEVRREKKATIHKDEEAPVQPGASSTCAFCVCRTCSPPTGRR